MTKLNYALFYFEKKNYKIKHFSLNQHIKNFLHLSTLNI